MTELASEQFDVKKRVPDQLRSGDSMHPRDDAAAPADALAFLHGAVGNGAVANLFSGNSGMPLPAGLQDDMERRFGCDFADVRIHDNPRAASCAGSFSAKAITVGNNIAFSRGYFSPHAHVGKKLIAHELAHVVQQRRGGPPPALDPSGPLERSADLASDSCASTSGEVGVSGAASPGVSRDVFDAQDDLDKFLGDQKGAGIPIDPRHLPSFESKQHNALLKKLPNFEQIMRQAARANRVEELKNDRGPKKEPPPPPPPPPPTPSPQPPVQGDIPVPIPVTQPPAPDNNDPQPTTATALGYMGASNLGKGQSNVSLGVNYSHLTGGATSSLQLAAGLHDFRKTGEDPAADPTGGLAAVVAPSFDPAGNSSVAAYANPFLSPPDKHYNAGLYLGGVATGGQQPPGQSGSAIGPSGVVAGEALIGASRNQPLVTLGGNLGLTEQSVTKISPPADIKANVPPVYLKNALAFSGAGSAQFNLDYYNAGKGAEKSKTPRYTIVGEGMYTHTFGRPASSTSYAAGLGVLGNLRLGSGHTILSAGAFGGYRHEDDVIGKTTYSSGRPYGALVLGGSFW